MKLYNLLTLGLLALLLGSCAQDDPLPGSPDEKLYEVSLNFDISIDPATRGPRQLESTDCWQHVTDMRVYIFRSDSGEEGSFTYYYPAIRNTNTGADERQPYLSVSDFQKANDDDNWDDHQHGGMEEHNYSIIPMLGEGYYRFLAVGRDDAPASTPLKINWIQNQTKWEDALMENTAGHPRVSEIFTGYPKEADSDSPKTLYLPKEVYFHETITLRRAVAGILLNVKNIPTKLTSQFAWYSKDSPTGIIQQDMEKNVEYEIHEVSIVAAGYYPTLDLVNRRWHEPKPFQPDESRFFATRLASVSLKGLTKETGDYGKPVFRGPLRNGNFVFPAKLTDRVFYADYLGGEKADPESLTAFDKSLYLCFYTITRSGKYYPVRMVPIKIVRSTIHDPMSHDDCAGDDYLCKWGFHYNLVANHLYCLGTYNKTTGEDKPIDLDDALHHPELEITVIGAWQVDVNIDMNF